ncbi:MAG: DNA polymerase III subunit delta [Pseudomonadota bacterium]
MKLSAAAAARFAANPDPRLLGVLLHGPDPALIALHRRDLIPRLTEGDDLRLTRLDAETARRAPAEIDTGLRARGFFPGRRVLLIEGAKDSLASALTVALEGLTTEDAYLVVTASGITTKGALHRLFEKGAGFAAAGLYPDQAGQDDPVALLSALGCRARPDEGARAALLELAASLDPGCLRQTLNALALYASDAETLSAEDVEALAPLQPGAASGSDSTVEALLAAVAGGAPERVPALLARLSAAGTAPSTTILSMGRHLRQLLTLALAPGGPRSGVERLRPPVFGPRRDRLVGEAELWRAGRAETGLRLIHACELALRRAGPASARPERALAERCLIRLAMIAAEARR